MNVRRLFRQPRHRRARFLARASVSASPSASVSSSPSPSASSSPSVSASSSPSASPSPDNETWTLVVIPDTQRLAPNNASAYNSLMQWIVDNETLEDIQMVIHLGDYANLGTSSAEWAVIETAVDRLHANNIPFIHCAGNHDYDDDGKGAVYARPTSTYWETVFPAGDWSGKSWYVDEYDGITTNQASTLTIGNTKYLFLTFEIWPRAEVITWAEGVITDEAPDKIIVGTHGYMAPDSSIDSDDGSLASGGQGGAPKFYAYCDYRTDANCNAGDEFYTNFVSQHDNIILVCNGHDVASTNAGNGVLGETAFSKRTDIVGGNTIHSHLFNYQNDSANTYANSAYLRMYKFDHSDNSCDVTTYNPVRDTNHTDSENQFSFNFT